MIAILAVVAETTAETTAVASPGEHLAIAFALLVVALALALLEIVIISGGALAVASIGCGIAAVAYAFAAGPLAGWVFALLTPILGIVLMRAGLAWMRKSSLVPKAAITADAGYHHAFEASGLAPGAVGVLVTAAMPSGRARFHGLQGAIEIDVHMRSGATDRGTAIVIKAIEGPVVFCLPAPTPVSESPTPTSSAHGS
jgi:membrane-bound ClpP family serine protease